MTEDDDTPSNVETEATIPEADRTKLENLAEGYSLIQKGLFLVVILSCVAVYLRMTGKKNKRFPEKSMV